MEKGQANYANFTLEIIGERIARVRKALGLKQHDVSSELGAMPLTITRLEKGKGASFKIFFKYISFLAERKVEVQALFATNFDIQEAFPNKFVEELKNQKAVEKKNSNSIPEFGKQVQDMIAVQQEKTNQSFDDLMNLTKTLTNFYNK
jgi:transcriptional regulator with XRE-family HTH domain